MPRFGEPGLHDFLTLPPKVGSQNMRKSARITSLQRVQDSLVLLNRKSPVFGGHRRDEPRPAYPRRYRFVKSGEYGVIGGANDALVDQPVAAIIRQQVAGAIVLDHADLQ